MKNSKHIIFFIFICEIIIFCVTGCYKNKDEFNTGAVSNIKSYNNNISVTIKENTLTNTGLTLIVKNNSDQVLYYGNQYEIEIKHKEKWHKINVELAFDEPLWELDKHKETEIEINWKNGYGNLPSGEYRLIKKAYFEDKKENKINTYILTEFTIQ